MVNWKQLINGSPFCKQEGKFSIFPNGYKVNRYIFLFGIMIMMGLLVLIFYMYGTNYQLYIKCENNGFCLNPFYENTFQKSNIPERLRSQCIYDWCDDKTLPSGFEFGEQPPSWIRNFWGVVGIILIICFLMNHLLYNKEFKLDNETDNN